MPLHRTWPLAVLLAASCDAPEGDLALFDDEIAVDELPVDRAPEPLFDMTLSADNFVAGTYAVLHVEGAPPNTLLRVASAGRLGAGPCPAVLSGRCLDIASSVRVATFAGYSDANGDAAIAFRLDPARGGGALAMQVAAVSPGSTLLSNPIFRLVGQRGFILDPDVDQDGDGYTPAEGDCADFAAGYNPDASDIVGDGRDQSCDDADGVDDDRDGFASQASGGADCVDDDPDAHPAGVEVCNGVDDDCDGATDPLGTPGSSTFYADADSDGYGDPASTVSACSQPSGYVTTGTDCRDDVAGAHPGGTEVCNGVDDDCDLSTDEGLTTPIVFSYTGNHQTWTVPGGITSVQVAAWGGGGGAAQSGGNIGRGGGGGFAGGALSVTPGEALVVTVGGGGTRFTGDTAHYGGGGGLGGVFAGSYAHANALIIAGGGGGGLHCTYRNDGSGGGGSSGQMGHSGCTGTTNYSGFGGTPTAGGARATTFVTGTAPLAGGPLQGGQGGDFRSNTVPAFGGGGAGGIGGGGGGGYYGGGGGGHEGGVSAGGGGGGSGYLHPTRVTGGSLVAGAGSSAARTDHAQYGAGAGAGSVGAGEGAPARVVITPVCAP